jgi:hypothetical protein
MTTTTGRAQSRCNQTDAHTLVHEQESSTASLTGCPPAGGVKNSSIGRASAQPVTDTLPRCAIRVHTLGMSAGQRTGGYSTNPRRISPPPACRCGRPAPKRLPAPPYRPDHGRRTPASKFSTADRVDHHVGAVAVGRVLDSFDDVEFLGVNGEGGPELTGPVQLALFGAPRRSARPPTDTLRS